MTLIYRVRYLERKKMNHNNIISEYFFTTKKEAEKFQETLEALTIATINELYLHDDHEMALEQKDKLEKMSIN